MERTAILAAGDFPRKGGEPYRLLASAGRVVACDGAAAEFHRKFGRWPDVVVGDLDSLGGCLPECAVRVADQETNDLAKAIAFCRDKGWNGLVVLGATGKREDHTIGNVYRALEARLPIVTENGEFIPVGSETSFKTWIGTGVSVFAPDPDTRMRSNGLKWRLDGVRFTAPYVATLNRASAETVTVASDRPAFVFVERNRAAVRAAVSLGSNVGDRAGSLRRALKALSELPGTRLADASETIETEGIDVPAEFAHLKFLNQAALFETTLDPLAFSRAMHAIEDRLGRVRTVRNGPRTIDIDLVDFGGVRMETRELTLPHPRAKERPFVVEPLKSIGVFL